MPDSDDLRDCIGGDARACDRLAASVLARVVASAWHVLRRYDRHAERAEAEDVAQDVFVRVFKDDRRLLRGFDAARASLDTWLAVIARGIAVDHLRRRRPRQLDRALAEAGALPAPEIAAEPALILPEGLLTARQRLVIQLLFADGLEVDEAARVLGIEPQSVRSAKHKALTALRAFYRVGDVSGPSSVYREPS